MQESSHEPINKLDPIDDWTIDSTHLLVRLLLTIHCRSVTLPLASHAGGPTRRNLFGNQLIGPIPETISQLTALAVLYVRVETYPCRSSRLLCGYTAWKIGVLHSTS